MNIYDNLDLTEFDIQKFADDAQVWLSTNGGLMEDAVNKQLSCVPFVLFPTPFPRYLVEEAMLVQRDFQTLCHLASLDHSFLEETLRRVIIHDTFTRRLYEIYDNVRKEGCKPKFYFNITRSDYMIDPVKTSVAISSGSQSTERRPYEIKQIEMNMIAAGGAGRSTTVGKLHRFMADVMGDKCPYEQENLLSCDSIGEQGAGLANAWKHYNVEDSIVIFVIKDGLRILNAHRLLEYSFYDNIRKLGHQQDIPVLFQSLQQIYKNGHLSCDRRILVDEKEVALFYFRSGYNPNSYSELDWKGRYLVERSVAVKCPTVAEQLVGTKKVQQVFAVPGMVEKFIKDPESAKRIRETFAGLYTLDPCPEGDEVCQMALDDPSAYVLKPQREGGGNNLYDDEMVKELNRLRDPVERSQYILMELIKPPTVKNYIVRANFEKLRLVDTIAELGIFGIFLRDGKEEIVNKSSGYLLRSKNIEHKDGGTLSGRTVLDTPYQIS